MEDYFVIGKIVNTQGIKGDVRVIPATDDPTRFELLSYVYVLAGNDTEKMNIDKVWYHKQFVILKFKEINNMTEAERYKNAILKIPAEMALPLEEDEFYMRDLFSMSVYTDDGEYLGILDDIIQTGANDVYVIKDNENNKKDLLIPAIKQCIIDIDIPNKKMTVKLLEGLRD